MAVDAQFSAREKYDVFLSFRGPDTRKGFTDCLFEFLAEAGIRVFMDDEELRVGESIAGGIQKAIYDSKLFVPVFSRGYASSKWCLKEIAWMQDCMEEFPGTKEMLPIFYDVDARDVKLKTDLYTKALLEHEKTSGSETVERWEKALIKVPEVKGWNLRDAEGQGKLIKEIVQHICRSLDLNHRRLPQYFIGVEEHVQHIMDKLDCRSSDVRIVVIHGMGGIGKTTLASAVFNKIRWQFQGCSFLLNVRESAVGKGMVDLQKKLLRDVIRFSSPNFCDENDAMNCISRSLRGRDVLVVLDDVSDRDQIRKLVGMGDWVGPGSRVIITTKNLNCIASVEEIENNFTILRGKKIYVYQMGELGFDNSLQLLCWHAFNQQVPSSGYEQLSRDILSLTGGVPLALEVIGSYLRGKSVTIWNEVLNRLKKVPDERLYGEILMSSFEKLCKEVQEIFLDIAFFFANHEKKAASYYWEACGLFPEIGMDTLISHALVKIDHSNRIRMHDFLRDLGREVVRRQSIENLERRSRLCNDDARRLLLKRKRTDVVKALKLDSYHAHDFSPAQLSRLSSLRQLELCGGNFVGKFRDSCLSELVWLSWRDCPHDFHGSNLYFDNLVVLRLSGSHITDTWAGWEQFKTAKNLKLLELKGLNLTTTPNLASYSSLERLVVRDCASLVHIDPSIGNLECLNSIEIIRFFYNPSDRVHYESRNEVLCMPSSICKLKALSRLEIVGFKLKQLPENIGELKGLKVMRITGCRSLRHLPDSICDLESLCELYLSGAGITALPESIGKLRNLNWLDVSHNRLRGLPTSIVALDRLVVLRGSHSVDLQGEIPSLIGQLSRLESLSLGYCDKIPELSDLPTSLTKLWISSQSLKAVLELSRLTNLVDLSLSIGGIPKVPTGGTTDYLSAGMDQLSRQWGLSSVMSLPSGLKSLTLHHFATLSRWECLSNLESLSTLILHRLGATEIQLDGLESLMNLTSLVIQDCEFLERVHDISRLQNLRSLELLGCPKLVEIGDLTQLPESLRYFSIWFCNSIRCLPDRSGIESPCELHLKVYDCSKLWDFQGPYDSYFQGGKEREKARNE